MMGVKAFLHRGRARAASFCKSVFLALWATLPILIGAAWLAGMIWLNWRIK